MTTTSKNNNEKAILMVGETFTVLTRRERPRLTFFPGSLNSQKALACVAFSSPNYQDVELNIINYPEDNQTLDFARINPNMTIPVLEIDDKIITDSRDIQRYLTEKYPGKGDSEADKETIERFNDCVCSWDEYLFSYRKIPTFLGAAIHNIRLVCQVDSVNQAVKEGVLDEVLRGGQTIRQAFVKKIAQTRALVDVGVGEETPDLKRRIEENDKLLQGIFQQATALLAESGGPLLLGSNLTSTDAFFAAVFDRVDSIGDTDLKSSLYAQYEGTVEWWEYFKAQKETQPLFERGKAWTISSMILAGKPFKFLGYKLGWYVPGKLPDDIESEVQVQLKKLEDAYLE